MRRSDWCLHAILITCAAVMALPAELSVDDAYIHFQFARQIASGEGFCFNSGERVFGDGAVLYTLTLAALKLVCPFEVETLAALLHAASIVSCALTVVTLFRTSPLQPWSMLFGYALATQPMVRGTVGMEGVFFAALLLLAVKAMTLDRPGWLGVMCAALCLARPDGIVPAAVLWIAAWVRQKTIPWRTVWVAALLGAPWLLFAWVYFGTPVPHVIGAKQLHGQSGLWSTSAVWGGPAPAMPTRALATCNASRLLLEILTPRC